MPLVTNLRLELIITFLNKISADNGAIEALEASEFSDLLLEEYGNNTLEFYVRNLSLIEDNFSEEYLAKLTEIRDFLLQK